MCQLDTKSVLVSVLGLLANLLFLRQLQLQVVVLLISCFCNFGFDLLELLLLGIHVKRQLGIALLDFLGLLFVENLRGPHLRLRLLAQLLNLVFQQLDLGVDLEFTLLQFFSQFRSPSIQSRVAVGHHLRLSLLFRVLVRHFVFKGI